MPIPVVIALVVVGILTVGALFLIFFLVYRSAKGNSDFVERAKQIQVRMNAQDAFRIMNVKATTIEEDRDRVIVVWKIQQTIRFTTLTRSLKIVIDKNEKIVSVGGENLDRSAWI